MTDFNIYSTSTPSRTHACNVSLIDASVYLCNISWTEGQRYRAFALDSKKTRAKRNGICWMHLGGEREDLWWFDKYVIENSLQQMSLIPLTSSLILIYLNVNGCLRGKIIISLLFHNLSGMYI